MLLSVNRSSHYIDYCRQISGAVSEGDHNYIDPHAAQTVLCRIVRRVIQQTMTLQWRTDQYRCACSVAVWAVFDPPDIEKRSTHFQSFAPYMHAAYRTVKNVWNAAEMSKNMLPSYRLRSDHWASRPRSWQDICLHCSTMTRFGLTPLQYRLEFRRVSVLVRVRYNKNEYGEHRYSSSRRVKDMLQ